jgi:hypothetical protein
MPTHLPTVRRRRRWLAGALVDALSASMTLTNVNACTKEPP